MPHGVLETQGQKMIFSFLVLICGELCFGGAAPADQSPILYPPSMMHTL